MIGPKVWTSELIQETLDKLRMGLPTNMGAFHATDIELKAAELLYQLTPYEQDEFHKCSHDIVYFVEKYCRFLTDSGRKTVLLRDYQKIILRSLAKEVYNDKVDDMVPNTRNLIMLQSRQSGKCLFNSDILLQYPSGDTYKVPISLFYYMTKQTKQKLTILERIKVKLLMLYIRLSS